jgi:hypothetical protein
LFPSSTKLSVGAPDGADTDNRKGIPQEGRITADRDGWFLNVGGITREPPPGCLFPARGAVFVSRIIAGDFDWNKANHCDCAINMFISLFTYIF